jgi:hypothetical protein
MLVALRVVREAEARQVSRAADALDKMRERFLLFGVHAPLDGSRGCARTVRRSRTTSMGYIY